MSTLWETMLQDFIKEYKSDPKNFLRMRTISKTVHPNQQPLAELYYNELMESEFFKENILPYMVDSIIGNPYQFRLLPQCSPLTVQHSYQLN